MTRELVRVEERDEIVLSTLVRLVLLVRKCVLPIGKYRPFQEMRLFPKTVELNENSVISTITARFIAWVDGDREIEIKMESAPWPSTGLPKLFAIKWTNPNGTVVTLTIGRSTIETLFLGGEMVLGSD